MNCMLKIHVVICKIKIKMVYHTLRKAWAPKTAGHK